MRLESVIDLLRALPLFAGVSPEALRLLAFSATARNFRPGDILFRRGDAADGAYLITTGEVVLDRADDGSPSNHVFGPGTLLGQLALFTAIERPATAITRGATSVLVISRDLMLKVLDAHPESAVQLRATLAQQVSDMGARIARVSG
jgi:CRP-like cAMP-binding protein